MQDKVDDETKTVWEEENDGECEEVARGFDDSP